MKDKTIKGDGDVKIETKFNVGDTFYAGYLNIGNVHLIVNGPHKILSVEVTASQAKNGTEVQHRQTIIYKTNTGGNYHDEYCFDTAESALKYAQLLWADELKRRAKESAAAA